MEGLGVSHPHRLMRAAWLGLLATWCGIASHPLLAQGQPAALVGSVHGFVVADVPSAGGRGNIPLPNARVTVSNAATSAPGGETFTTLAGLFSTPLQPAGTYRVCATAGEFATSVTVGIGPCSRKIVVFR